MRNSSFSVFSVYQNVKSVIEKRKYNTNIEKEVYRGWYQKARPFTVNHCKRIYNDIENGYYTYDELIIYLLTKALFEDTIVGYSKIDETLIKRTMKLYSKKQLTTDKKFIKEINKDVKLNSIKDFFEINEEGENLIFTLTSKNFISPALYLKYSKKYLTMDTENTILFKNNEYQKYEKVNNLIIKYLTRRFRNEQEV